VGLSNMAMVDPGAVVQMNVNAILFYGYGIGCVFFWYYVWVYAEWVYNQAVPVVRRWMGACNERSWRRIFLT